MKIVKYKDNPILKPNSNSWESRCVLNPAVVYDNVKEKFIMLYHAVDKDGIYRVGAVLLDLNDPTKILARTKHFIMEPETSYEKSGIYNGCVFPTGNVVKDDILYIYYGCVDVYISVATVKFSELIKELKDGRL